MNSQSALQGIPENVTIADLSRYIVQTNRKYDLSIIVSAYEFAVLAHGNQKRSSGEPYIVHPLSVAWILVSLGMDTECICAGYCMMWWKIPSIRWMMSVSGSDGILPVGGWCHKIGAYEIPCP